jgi:superfamily II DNA or RNA helicase
MTDYETFLAQKRLTAPLAGFECGPIDERLFPFQRDIVRWALRKGKAAIWADCGLGKTLMALEWARHVIQHCDAGGKILILTPLAVAQQFRAEGEKFGIPVTVCKIATDVQPGINVTNYERLHLFDVSQFVGIVADESSILKDYTSATRNALIETFAKTPFRLACTATPSPNDIMELGNHAEFLGVMTRTEMLAMWFIHDGGKTSDWRLKGHAQKLFWSWVTTWAVSISNPADICHCECHASR